MAGGAEGLRLRPPLTVDDSRLRQWLRTPEVQQWWGSTASAQARMHLARDSTTAIRRIIDLDGEPIGYAQAMDIDAAQPVATADIPAGAWDCDLFIGSGRHRGQGLGQAALRLLSNEVFGSTLAVACSMLVSIRNERAARATEKAGFRWVRITHDPMLGPCWVMLRQRPRL